MSEVIAPVGPNVKTIVWDLDGTLLNSFDIFDHCLNSVLCEDGMSPAPVQVLQRNYHGTLEDSIAGVLIDMGHSVDDGMLENLRQRFIARDNAYIQDVDPHLFDDAVDLAKRAHEAGKRQIVVTNRSHGTGRQNASPRNVVQNSQLCAYIDTVICGDDSVYRKPMKEVLGAHFGSDLTMLGEIRVVGDQFVDAAFARNLGTTAILVARTGDVAHLDRLDNWGEYVSIVSDLRQVTI